MHLFERIPTKIKINLKILRLENTLNMIWWVTRRHVYLFSSISLAIGLARSGKYAAKASHTPDFWVLFVSLFLQAHSDSTLLSEVWAIWIDHCWIIVIANLEFEITFRATWYWMWCNYLNIINNTLRLYGISIGNSNPVLSAVRYD